jgi:hypothetical protein
MVVPITLLLRLTLHLHEAASAVLSQQGGEAQAGVSDPRRHEQSNDSTLRQGAFGAGVGPEVGESRAPRRSPSGTPPQQTGVFSAVRGGSLPVASYSRRISRISLGFPESRVG